MKPLWLPNIKRWLGGTVVGSDVCLNVSVKDQPAINLGTYAYLEHRFMDAAITQINGSGGAWKEIGDTPADVANTIEEFRVNANLGAALQFGKGANAGAVTVIGVCGAGQTTSFGVSLVATDKIWVKAIQTNNVNSGELLVSLMG